MQITAWNYVGADCYKQGYALFIGSVFDLPSFTSKGVVSCWRHCKRVKTEQGLTTVFYGPGYKEYECLNEIYPEEAFDMPRKKIVEPPAPEQTAKPAEAVKPAEPVKPVTFSLPERIVRRIEWTKEWKARHARNEEEAARTNALKLDAYEKELGEILSLNEYALSPIMRISVEAEP